MRQFKKTLTVMTAAGILAVSTLTGCGGSVNNDAVVTQVGEDKVTLGVANFYARMQQAQYETYYAGTMGTTGEEMWKQETEKDTTFEDTTKKTILESLENMYLLKQHAGEYEVTLSDDDKKAISKAADKFIEDNTLEDKEVVSGYKKYVQEFLELATIQQKMDAPMKKGVNEEVSDEEAAQKSMQYVSFPYSTTGEDGNTVTLTDDEKAALKEKAQTLVDTWRANPGANVEDAAKEAGVEVQKATFDAETTSPSADLVKAVDALENEGDVSELIDTDSGIYVGKLTSKLDREATDAKKKTIIDERKQAQYDSLVEKWRKDTEIKEDKKVWKKVSFEDQGVTVKESQEAYTE